MGLFQHIDNFTFDLLSFKLIYNGKYDFAFKF
jgi:hypothetical protein